MTPEEINEAIAESIGVKPVLEWQVMNHDETASCMSGERYECENWLARLQIECPESPYAAYHVGAWKRYPNYHGSLDAIVPVVRAMNIHSQDDFAKELYKATPDTLAILATPAQWCEAYLKSKGLWK